MKRVIIPACLLFALFFTESVFAANEITASADANCGVISVSGIVTLDSCCSAGTVIVQIFKEGCAGDTVDTMSGGTSTFRFAAKKTGYSAGTYTVITTVSITDACSITQDYIYRTTVTVN